MLCEECGQRLANVHVTRVVNGEVSAQHLCSQCAREKGEFQIMADPGALIQHLMGALAGHPEVRSRAETWTCSSCGMPFGQFQATGRLGCPVCYESFKTALQPLIARIQADQRHRGRVPARLGPGEKRLQEIRNLKEELQRLVDREAYEEAAQVRDRIRLLETRAEGDGAT